MSTPWTLTGLQTARNDLLERREIFVGVMGTTDENVAKIGELQQYLTAQNIRAFYSGEGEWVRVTLTEKLNVLPQRKPSKDLRASEDQVARYKQQRDAGS